MKKLLILVSLCLTLVQAEDTLILSGFSQHGHKADKHGEVYESAHLGIGYEHLNGNHSYTIMALSDSYNHRMYIATYGYNKHLVKSKDFGIRVGAEFGFTLKKIKYASTTGVTSFHYSIMPIAFIPKVVFRYKRVSMNFIYVPYVKVGTREVAEVTYVNFGISF